MSWKNGGAWHILSAMHLYQCRQTDISVTTMMSHLFQSNVIGMSFCQGTKHTGCFFLIVMVPDVYRHLNYDSREAWHTVFASVGHAHLKL